MKYDIVRSEQSSLELQRLHLSDKQNRWHFDVDRPGEHVVTLTTLGKKRKSIYATILSPIVGSILLLTLVSCSTQTRLPSQIAPIREVAQISIDRCSLNYKGSIEQFKNDLELEKEPRLMITDENRQAYMTDQLLMTLNKQFYHFKNFGIWVFFDMEGKFSSLRFEKPFAGNVGGVKIGDSFETLTKVRGEPYKNDSNRILYRESGAYHNYRTTRGKIVRVFTSRCDRLEDSE